MKSVSGFERVAAMFEPGKTSPGNMKGHRELGMHHVYSGANLTTLGDNE